jgi:hypothetical protein
MKKLLLLSVLLIFACSSSETQDVSDGSDIQFYTFTISTTIGGSVDTEGGTYEQGEQITITAIPEDGYIFKNFSGDENSTDNPITITMDDDINITANFIVNEVYSYNYNVPSHDWDNYHAPWFNLARITDSLGFSQNDSYNTNSAYADFNFDGYLDIMIQPNVNDGVPVESFFLINSGINTFFVDNNFPISYDTSAISSRKTVVGDFNGDNKPDVVRPQGGHDLLGKPTITLSNEDNSYTFKLIGNGPEIQPHTISSGDIDNDGDLDLFLGQAGEFDGFLINSGNATFEWKWISEVINDFDNGFLYPNGGYGYYGIWSSEMTDVDEDGFVDLILGGSYAENDYDPNFLGPTVFWGDGSGNYSNLNSTLLFNAAEINYAEGNTISLSHDYAVNDVDGDGIKDVAIFSECSDVWMYHIIKGSGNRQFEDKTSDWLPNNILYNSSSHVWIKLMDIDNNGLIDLVEGEPLIRTIDGVFRTSVRWEWNGGGFTEIN